MTRTIGYFVRNPLIIGVVILGGALGAATGVLFANSSDLPIITELDDYAPETITRVHDRAGEVIGESPHSAGSSSSTRTSPRCCATR